MQLSSSKGCARFAIFAILKEMGFGYFAFFFNQREENHTITAAPEISVVLADCNLIISGLATRCTISVSRFCTLPSF